MFSRLSVSVRARDITQKYKILILICVVYYFSLYSIARWNGTPEYLQFSSYASVLGPLQIATLFIVSIYNAASHLWQERPKSPISLLYTKLTRHLDEIGGVFAYIVPFMIIYILTSTLTAAKILIPHVNAFSWDNSFLHLDRLLHFGIDPWKITHLFFGNEIATFALNYMYNVWFALLWIGLIFAIMTTKKRVLAMQYLISFALCWIILGSVLAMIFSSAGPCYYGVVVDGPNPYAPLMEQLQAINSSLTEKYDLELLALDTQAYLWAAYTGEENALGGGISAMPSMHVSIAALMALGAWQMRRSLGIIMTVFAILIQIGSVHLGWHYAVDGYFSILATILIWKAVGWCLSRQQDKDMVMTAPQTVPEALH